MQHEAELSKIGIEAWLEGYQRQELLRILTCGSVDDGKSTLIGRLLHDAAGVFDDQMSALKRDTTRFGTTGEEIDFALLLDGLQAEREQGITIDVAYRYFSTPRRKFIIADTPGHEQYTRNMATGASNSDLAIILIDARKGVLPQTRRHAFICSLLGIKHVVLAINKMDLVNYQEAIFQQIRRDCEDFLAKLQIADLHFIPLCARKGENVVEPSPNMPWYQGGPLLAYLESVHIASDENLIDFRLPVQLVLRPNLDFRGFAGTIASGVLRRGEEVVSMPSGKKSKVVQILAAGSAVEEAFAPQAVVITLEDEIDASRGDCFVKPGNAPMMENAVEAMVVWMSEEALKPGKNLLLKHTSLTVPATLGELRYKMDINSLRSEPASSLALNEIGRVRLECVRSLACDAYEKNRHTGAFILIDRLSNATLGAGMILDRTPAEEALERRRRAHDAGKNLRERRSQISTEARASALGQKPAVLWLTGLPRSGKSSLAYALEAQLFARGTRCVVLDGESLRRGLCSDLGFAPADRDEHVRRSSELARLLADQGWVVIAALVSASTQQRQQARATVGAERFVEVHCDAPLDVCEARDADGLYARARAGELAHVTGIDHAYEAPLQPELRLDTARASLEENVQLLLGELQRRGFGRLR